MAVQMRLTGERSEVPLVGFDRKTLVIFLSLLIVGIALRLGLAAYGYNNDVEAYRVIADLTDRGKSVYTETDRYNYGPIWFNILWALDQVPWNSPDPTWALRWKVAIFLSGVDCFIAYVLTRWYSLFIAAIFFLNPISIIITGYHSQFDNLAVFTAILAARLIRDREATAGVRKISGLTLLGVSLIIKHIAFIFPIWLFFSFETRRMKVLAVLIPYGLFFLSFVPYWRSLSGIVRHVFLYHSIPNGPFWKEIAPGFVANKLVLPIFFLLAMLIAGLLWRNRAAPRALWLYFVSLVVFSPAIANQYLAIPVSAISVNWNLFYGIYTLFATFFITGNYDGLHLPLLAPVYPDGGINAVGYGVNKFLGYREVIFALFLGLVYQEMTKDQRAGVFTKVRELGTWIRAQASQQWKELWTP
jgi:hypothetical protein